jgi:acetyl esterase/lipase
MRSSFYENQNVLKSRSSPPIEGLLPIKHVHRKVLLERDRIRNMTSQYRVVDLMRRRHAWLCFTIAAAVLSSEIAQPLLARRRPIEVANAAVQRSLVYKRVNGIVLTLDLYRPEDVSGLLPVILCVHGGHWDAGGKDRCPAVTLVQDGYAVASINYRRTRTAPFPAQLEDCKAAVRWLRANASTYHLDPDRIGVWGYSAGGHLAALLGTTAGVPELEGSGDNMQYSSQVQAVCVVAGPSDLSAMTSLGPKRTSAIEGLLGGPLEEDKARAIAASPIHYVSKDDPPFLIVHGEADRVIPVEQGQRLYEELRKAGVNATLKILPVGHRAIQTDALKDAEVFFDATLKKR